ncbi:MAG: ATP-binding protein [Pseudobdellovibrionaceae bacterium]
MSAFLKLIKNLSIRTHLIVGVTLVHALLMSGFVFDRIVQEEQVLNQQVNETTFSIAKALAVSSSSWVISRDIAGLDELIQAHKHFSNLNYAFIVTPEGKVLAHTDSRHIGEYINDLKGVHLLKAAPQVSLVYSDEKMVDYAAPIVVQNKLIGWARVALNRDEINRRIIDVMIKGIFYSLFAVSLGGLMAWGISHLLTSQLEALAKVADSIRKGNHALRANEDSTNEVGRLAAGFNQMMTALNESKQKLIQSEKMASLGEMAAGIAHEINNPLSIIIGKSERFKRPSENLSPEKSKAEFEKLYLTAKRIDKIVKSLVRFSRSAELDPHENVNLNDVLSESLSLCSEGLKNRSINLQIDAAEKVHLVCQPVQLSQVFINLINNAADAIQNEPEKWIRIEFKTVNKNKVLISFTDSGPGIPESIASKIMQPFYTTKEVGKGTGLGLSISKSIIEEHGGHFYLDKNSQNTCFKIELPISV